ncbi:MAG: tripartite tricarboxylate transporter substrate-binding protein, partial [Burkholderiales bacterium]|nr:tripartite tricarboxylate transporter substrate-binding protein [Burkholderiales bacterium]
MKATHDGRSTTFAPMLAKFLCAGLAALLSQPLLAQTGYPAKPIRIVSPFATGGTNDYLARMMGRVLTDAWGRAVVIENRPGAGGNIGTEVVARSAGDGYTLLMGSVTTHAINPVLYAKLPFNAEHDFAPVSGVAATQIVLTVHPSVPARTARDLLGLAKSRPQQLQYGSAGSGSISHMATELLSYTSGMRFQHVPYKGEGQAALDVISGQIDFMFANIPSVLGMVRAGKLRAIAVGGNAR